MKIATKLIFGSGKISEINKELTEIGAHNLLLVTDKGIAKTEIMKQILELTENNFNTSVFDKVEPNPKDTTISKGLKFFKENNCDSVVGLGGGSSMDTAKAVAAMSRNPGKINQYEGIEKIKYPASPIMLVPTTAGTGSEVSRGAVITDTKRNYKMLVLSWHFAAKTAILDPKLTLSLPKKITAHTGLDALTHAIEAYVSSFSDPYTDLFSLEAIRLISKNIILVTRNGSNLDARSKMLMASNLAGIAMTNALLGNVHALAHSIGGHFDTPHGLTCALLLPEVMEFNSKEKPEKFAKIAKVMGKKTENISIMDAARKAIEAIEELKIELGIPKNLKITGVNEDNIDKIVESAAILPSNPRKTTKNDYKNILQNILEKGN